MINNAHSKHRFNLLFVLLIYMLNKYRKLNLLPTVHIDLHCILACLGRVIM